MHDCGVYIVENSTLYSQIILTGCIFVMGIEPRSHNLQLTEVLSWFAVICYVVWYVVVVVVLCGVICDMICGVNVVWDFNNWTLQEFQSQVHISLFFATFLNLYHSPVVSCPPSKRFQLYKLYHVLLYFTPIIIRRRTQCISGLDSNQVECLAQLCCFFWWYLCLCICISVWIWRTK